MTQFIEIWDAQLSQQIWERSHDSFMKCKGDMELVQVVQFINEKEGGTIENKMFNIIYGTCWIQSTFWSTSELKSK